MYSTKSTSTWVSQTFSQDAGDTNWTAYQIAMTGASKKYSIYSTGTTASTLSTYDGNDIVYGAPLWLSTDGTSFVTGTAGTITTTAPLFPTPTKVTAQSVVAPAYMTTAPTYGQPMFMKPDGTKYWYVSNTGSTLREVSLTTAWDMSTAADSAKTIGGFGLYGFCFSPDGRILFSSEGTNVFVRYLGTAWDITTAGAPSSWALPSGNISYCRCMRISSDGLNLYLSNNGSNTGTYNFIYHYQLNMPYQVGNWTTPNAATSTSNTFGTTSGCLTGFELTPNGKTLIVGYYDGTNHTIKAFMLTAPWLVTNANQGQVGTTFTTATSNYTSGGSTGGFVLDPTGTKLIYFGGTKGFETFTIDANTKYNVNLVSFALGAAPTIAYAQPPRVFADMEATTPQVNLMPVEQDWISSTTTQVVFGGNGAGLVAVGDNLQLNYTTNVPITSVSASTTGGLAAATLATKIQYTGKYLTLPFNNYGMRFRPDGSMVYFTDQTRIYTYSLSVPWDITTAVQTSVVYMPAITSGTVVGIDFNATGTKLFIHMFVADSNVRLYEYNLSAPWVLQSLLATGRWMQTWTATNYTPAGGRFNETGTQFYFNAAYSSSRYIRAWMLSTPYDIGTATTSYDFSNSYSAGAAWPPLLEPGGKYLLTSHSYTGEQTLVTANNFFDGISATADVSNNSGLVVSWPAQGGGQSPAYAHDFSPDGMRYYATFANWKSNWVYQHRVRTKPLTQYTATFATQGSAPTSVSIPDRSTELTVTPSLSGGNMVLTTPQTSKTGRALAVKVVSNSAFTNISNMTLNVWKA